MFVNVDVEPVADTTHVLKQLQILNFAREEFLYEV